MLITSERKSVAPPPSSSQKTDEDDIGDNHYHNDAQVLSLTIMINRTSVTACQNFQDNCTEDRRVQRNPRIAYFEYDYDYLQQQL
jgi:hypothetical protein